MTEPAHLDQTRAAYDTVAASYAEQLRDRLDEQPTDRAMLTLFAELARAQNPDGQVVDVGCGPGHITAFLADLGLSISGIDLSPAMVEAAREMHPGIRFSAGSMLGLELPDATLAGLAAWYSIIHTPPEQLPSVFTEFHRVLESGAPIALAFQVGDELRHVDRGYGHDVSLDAYRLPPERIAGMLVDAGFVMHSVTAREPEAPETVRQAYLIARKA